MSRASPAYARFASFLIRLGEVPFFGLSSALAAGLAGSGAVLHYSFAALLLAAGLLLLAAGIALGRKRPVLALVTALGGVFMGGMTLGLARRDAPPRDSVASLLSRGRLPLGDVIEFDGCVAEEATERGSDMALLVDLRGLKLAGSWVPARGRVPVRYAIPPDPGTAVALPVDYGDRIRGWARFDVPRNYGNPGAIDFAGALRRKGIHVLARVRSPRLFETLAGDCGSLWGRTAASLRSRVQTHLARLRDQGKARQAAILGSVVLGDDAHLDPAAREAFQNSGTYHVLVVSGLHVAWIAWLLWRILRFCPLPPWGSRALIAAAIFFYAEVVGFQASVTRCLWMLALCFVGQSVFRGAAPLNVVFAAGFCLLAVRPDWLFDAGFQLSFTSVLAIVSLAVPLIDRAFRPCWDPLRFAGREDRLFSRQGTWYRFGRRIRVTTELFAEACGDRLGRPLEAVILRCARCGGRAALAISTMVWISVAVQLWLAPVLAFYFNRISWVVPLANLLAVPAASILLCMGLLAALCAGVLVPASWAYGAAAAVSSLLWQITEWLGSISGSWQRCPTPPAAWVVAGLVLMGTWSVLRWRRKWIPAVLICIQMFCLGT
ncbi:MAG: ComEC family competence protein, partial [Acidobacteria bacterium]|nr:ComEC family competence protein [Acidobacteriota bacterium]